VTLIDDDDGIVVVKVQGSLARYNQHMAAIEQLLAEFFATNPHGAAAVYLFGSTARGTARPESDIDLGVLFADAPPATLDAQPYELEHALEQRLGRPVEVVVLNRAAIDLRSRVLRDGHLVVETDRGARIAFEVRTRNEAFDLEPILRRYRAPREVRR
jgi:predicted nucleotidyltransferase